MTRFFTETDPAFNLPVDTIYYIESAHNAELNDFVQKNKADIEKLLAKSTLLDYKLVYIGRSHWQNAQLQNLLQLKFPEKTQAEIEALRTNILAKYEGKNKISKLLKHIRQKFTRKKRNIDIRFSGINFMCRLLPRKYETDKYCFLTMTLGMDSPEKLNENIADFLRKLDCYNDNTLNTQDEQVPIRFQAVDDSADYLIGEEDYEGKLQKLLASAACKKTADEAEIEEAPVEIGNAPAENNLREMAQKIRDEIAAMQRENGINILVEILGDDLLATLKKLQPASLSRICIDENMNVFLPDYQNKEVKMNALSKTLYCLFLLHPKGIRIKDLYDHKSELLTIYKLISNRENLDTLTKSIDELCDPLSNSINEKLSRIRKAFCDIMASDLAQEYIPDGWRGEAKRIRLDRKLVILPQILKNIAK